MPRKAHRSSSKQDPKEELLNELAALGRKLEAAVTAAMGSKEAQELKSQAKKAAKAGAAASGEHAEILVKTLTAGIQNLSKELETLAARLKDRNG